MTSDVWYFDQSRLADSPSRKHGISPEREQASLQQTANFIQDMGRRLNLPIICINTAVLFTRRFYLFHSLKIFENFRLGASALFLAAKVEETPRKVEHICSTAKMLGVFKREVKDAVYIEEIIVNENAILLTLGFEMRVIHPHAQILKACDHLKCTKDFSSTAYLLATYCLHLTNMSVKYRPPAIACVSIHMASVTTQTPIPRTSDGRKWFLIVDPTMNEAILEKLTSEFCTSIAHCPENCKKKTLNTYFENLVKSNKVSSGQWGLPVVKSPEAVGAPSDTTVASPSVSFTSANESASRDVKSMLTDIPSALISVAKNKSHESTKSPISPNSEEENCHRVERLISEAKLANQSIFDPSPAAAAAVLRDKKTLNKPKVSEHSHSYSSSVPDSIGEKRERALHAMSKTGGLKITISKSRLKEMPPPPPQPFSLEPPSGRLIEPNSNKIPSHQHLRISSNIPNANKPYGTQGNSQMFPAGPHQQNLLRSNNLHMNHNILHSTPFPSNMPPDANFFKTAQILRNSVSYPGAHTPQSPHKQQAISNWRSLIPSHLEWSQPQEQTYLMDCEEPGGSAANNSFEQIPKRFKYN